jgi:hypothetical protein
MVEAKTVPERDSVALPRAPGIWPRCRRLVAAWLRVPASRLLRIYDRLCGRRAVHLIHIGKTGGTALKHVLKTHSLTPRYRIVLHNHACTLRDVPAGDGVIFFLRDPISRFVSGFYSRMRQGRPRYFYPWSDAEAAAFARFQTPNQLALALGSADAALKEAAVAAMGAIQHVRSSYWDWFENESYFWSRRDDILFVGFQESLAADFENLKDLLGLPDSAALPGEEAAMHRNPAELDRRLDPQALANLSQWYRLDYAFIDLCRSLGEMPNSGRNP